MHRNGLRRQLLLWGTLGLWLGTPFLPAARGAEKLKVDELLARHLASIGSAEARAAAKNRVSEGSAVAVFRLGGTGELKGLASLVSEGRKARLVMAFGHLQYPGELVTFDGKDLEIGAAQPGARFPLAKFIRDYPGLVSSGLMGGTTSLGWCLLETPLQGKAEYRGLQRVEDGLLHEMRYRPRKGLSDFQVSLYFEPETFRHVRSVYRLTIAPYMASTPEASSRLRDSYWKMIEEFGEFSPVDGLTLPHSYKLVLSYDGQDRSFLADWELSFTRITHNQPLGPEVFKPH